MIKIKLKKHLNNIGFTLLEVLVTTAIIGILFVVSTAVFINTIRSANKANITNEAKENASLVIEKLQKDIRLAVGIVTPAGDSSTLTIDVGTGQIVWECIPQSGNANGYFRRRTGAVGTEITVTNRDPVNGVSLKDCSQVFNIQAGSNALINLNFSFYQGATAGVTSDLETLVTHRSSIAVRGY